MHIFRVYMRTTGTSYDLIIDLHNKPAFTRALRKGHFTKRGAQLLQKQIFVPIIQQSANGGIRGHLGLIFKFPDLSQIRTFGRVQSGLSSRFGPSCSVTQQRLASRKTARMEIRKSLGRLRSFRALALGANQGPITPLTLAVSVTALQARLL